MMAALALISAPAAAQPDAPTMGRSIATLAQVPLLSRSGAPTKFGSRIAPGKPTLVAFWASWCVPCYAEAPHLARMRRELGAGFTFLYIQRREGDPDPDQPPAHVARLLAYGGMSDVDYLSADIDGFRRILGADVASIEPGKVGLPRVYLFDRKGRQVYTAGGFWEPEILELERRLKLAVAER